MHYRLIVAALLALITSQAVAFDPAGARRYSSPDLYRPNVDGLIIHGQDSTGAVPNLTVPMPGRSVAPTLSAALAMTAQVEFFRRPEDGSDWGPGLQRAQQFLAQTGGVMRVSTPNRLVIASQVSLPKGNPPLVLRCDSTASIFVNDPKLTKGMFAGGGPSAAGGIGVEVEGCGFAGDTPTTGTGFVLTNANGMVFRNNAFTRMAAGILSTEGYALTLDGGSFDNVLRPFQSTGSAHNFVARRVKAYGGNQTFMFGGPTDNISISDGDFEGIATVLQMAGGSALRFVGNYVEYMVYDPIYSSAPLYGADFSNNWVALGQNNWSVVNWVGGQFKRNSIYNQTITFPSNTVDLEVADNLQSGTASVGAMPYQVPTLVNSWIQQPNYSSIGFRKAADGTVRLRGNLLNYTAALKSAAFQLPYGYRPATQRVFVAAGSSGPTTVTINGDGTVIVTATGGAGTDGNPYQAGLDGISFEPGT